MTMIKIYKKIRWMLVAAPLASLATPVFAQDEAPTKPVSVEFTLAGVSDYRFRGISLSDKDPAFQPSVTVTHNDSGLYFSVWGSNIAENSGSDIEVDFTAGISSQIGKITSSLGAVYYAYPGASDLNYVDLLASVGTDVGPLTVGMNVAYAPKQNNIGDQDNIYVAGTASLPIADSPFTINASLGYEDGAFGDRKTDWSLGVGAEIKGFSVSVSYIDTGHANEFGKLSKPTAVLSVSKSF
jgi:uncharacterized protein (TIGR02001 family)